LVTINSDRDIEWNNARNLLGDLKIMGRLTIKCKISIPQGGNVIVEDGGRLIIDQGLFKNACDNEWGKIIVKSGGLLEMNSTNISDYNIIVESGGTIILNGNIEITGNHNITVKTGAYICVKNGTVIELSDIYSVIRVLENVNIGINPNLSIQTYCVSSWVKSV
jgi:hypothetical protein